MRIKKGYQILLIPVGILILTMECSSKKQILPPVTSSPVTYFEDFTGDQLDRTKWNVYVSGEVFNNEQQAYVDSASTLYIVHGAEAEGAANGALVLQPGFSAGFRTTQNTSFDFISARINTKSLLEFTYGLAEARIKITEGKGFWPAWWLLGNGDWPATGEADIMEYIGEGWVNAAMHGPGYSGSTPLYSRYTLPDNSTVNDWHVYAVDWTSNSLNFMVDGKTFYRVAKADVEKYGKWAFDNPKHLILNFALGGAYPAGENNVTTPYKGLPDSSVQLIKDGKCKMLVDWIRITPPKQ